MSGRIGLTVSWVLYEMDIRIKKLMEHENDAIEVEDYVLAERCKIRREEYESFKFYIEAMRDNRKPNDMMYQ